MNHNIQRIGSLITILSLLLAYWCFGWQLTVILFLDFWGNNI